jgi:L-lysine exporter family protein LysE/ArgO
MFDSPSFGAGVALAFSLLVGIGPQNAFVLRQGLRREHVLAVVSACSLFDFLLEAAGVGGLGAAVRARPWLGVWFGAGGAVFLAAYGVFAWRRALRGESLPSQQGGASLSRNGALAQCVAFTFLNPNVYLDTVVLIGSVGAQQPRDAVLSYFIGAAGASTVWFFGLGFGARLLAPVFARARAWLVLDAIIGATMFTLAWVIGSQTLELARKLA